MQAFAEWLTATAACRWLQRATEDHPLFLASVQLLHLTGIAIIVAAAGLVAAGLLSRRQDREALAAFTRKAQAWVYAALVIQAATGVFLIIRWPSRILPSPVFLPKLATIAIGVLVLWLIARRLRAPVSPLRPGSVAGAAFGLALIVIWSGVVFLGRWVPFA